MMNYEGGSAGWPVFRVGKIGDTPVVWDISTGIMESADTGWCGTVPTNTQTNNLRIGTYEQYKAWKSGGNV